MVKVRASATPMRFLAIVPALITILGLMFLHQSPPTDASFYPKCQLYQWTGLACPTCGSTRALYELSRGNLGGALHQNALLIIAGLPLLVILLFKQLKFALFGRWNPIRVSHLRVVMILISVLVVFAVLRNLPFPPFTWLFPTRL